MSDFYYRLWFSIGPRRSGRTYQLALAAKAIGAVLVCHNQSYADEVAREYGIKTFSLGRDPRGLKGPFFFDHLALEQIGADYEHRVMALEKENRRLLAALRQEKGDE